MKSLLQNIGDYQILEKLGRGGMADVYLAVDRKENRRVALKLVERGEGPEAQEVLDAERLGAELQQRISMVDPRVPRIHAFGDLDGYFFIEMEFVEGNDLSTLIASRVLTSDDAARIACELCGILRNAHGMSLQVNGRDLRAIVHGDIKPKNIRIDNTGQVRVLDFGIAKGLSITRRLTSNVFGSVAYSSPERLESGSIDEMSDLWSVGVVLYEMIESSLPFEAASTERLETIIRSRSAIRPLSDSCPQALQQVIYKALSRSPGGRYQDAVQFAADLEACLSGTATLASQENEQTRRTVAVEEIETRRTVTGHEAEPRPAPKSESPMSSLLHAAKQHLFRARKWILTGSFVLLAGAGIWEGIAMHTAAQLKPDFVQNRLSIDSAWNKYQEIRKRSLLGFAPLILRGALRDSLIENSERVFNDYRNSDALSVRENDWLRAKRNMSRVVELDSGDRKSEAMLEYANGHLSRIRGAGKTDNRKSLDAIASFQRAASLEPKWPDPYLGMARTYIYNFGDNERGNQALEHARQLGHTFGKRDLAMVADAHKKRGLQDIENANLVKGTGQEKEFLNKAKSEFGEALKTYLQIAPWEDSTAQIQSVQDSLGAVEQRLSELDKPNSILPWNWFK
jgi:eukaryotic-like serine/threonine-protein kinase